MTDMGISELDAVLRAFGREIAAERVRRGWTQAELAKAASVVAGKVSTVQIGKIERGERGQLYEVWACAWALGLQFADAIAAAEAAGEAAAGDA